MEETLEGILSKIPPASRGTGKKVGVEVLKVEELRDKWMVVLKKDEKGVLLFSTIGTSIAHHFEYDIVMEPERLPL